MKSIKNIFTVVMGLLLLAAIPYSAMGETKKEKDKKKAKAQTEAAPDSLSTQIGGVKVKIGGTVDGMFVFRNTSTGSGLATNFGAVPFDNTVAYYGSESRLSAQASQFNLSLTDQVDGSDLKGYLETDFLGNSSTNLYVTANSDTLRLRQYWVDLKKSDIEFTIGQAYSLLTPGRKGISPENGDIFLTKNLDNSFQVGLAWTRAMQFRVAYHPSKDTTLGLSLENPDQYTTGVIFPSAYNAQMGTQFDNGANPASTNVFPDVIGKVAYDEDLFHLEAAGFVREFGAAYIVTNASFFPTYGPPMSTLNATGFGGELNAIIKLIPDFHLVGTSFFSSGGGRYLGGLGPDLVVKVASGPIFTATLSPVSAYGAIGGFETKLSQGTQLAGYFGFDQFESNSQIDPTNTTPGTHYIGFGGPNSANTNTHYIREFSVDLIQDIWNSQDHGALQWGLQYSYVDRRPDFTAAGAPPNADVNMLFTDVKYILP